MILDTSLRGLNGYEVSRMIRESGNSEIIIILLAWFSVQSLEMANAVGCNELVAKVVNVQELVEVAGKWSEMDAKKLQNVTRNA
jgi:CheY-like chemotaxis protein